MSLWKIRSWSREEARGTIESPGFDAPLEFDAAIALVDDFEVGEKVEVELEHQGSGSRVLKLWPQRSRPNVAATKQKPLPDYVAETIRAFSEQLGKSGPNRTLEVTSASTNVIELAIVHSCQKDRTVLAAARFLRPAYAQLEWRLQTGSHRLSAYRWSTWRQQNEELIATWSLDTATVESTAYVFALEPLSFSETRVQYIVAEDVELSVSGQS